MQPWVLKSMQRWPNVPALFGWLALDRRGRWLIKGEVITHPRIVETINRNYGVDAHGRWYFQNGPQRGYMTLEYAPFVLRLEDGAFTTHNGLSVQQPTHVYLDETGTLALATEHGLGEIRGDDLEWMLERLMLRGEPLTEAQLANMLDLPSMSSTNLVLDLGNARLPVTRLDVVAAPAVHGFCRDPQPLEGERVATRAPD